MRDSQEGMFGCLSKGNHHHIVCNIDLACIAMIFPGGEVGQSNLSMDGSAWHSDPTAGECSIGRQGLYLIVIAL
jgi:hypothetical protein